MSKAAFFRSVSFLYGAGAINTLQYVLEEARHLDPGDALGDESRPIMLPLPVIRDNRAALALVFARKARKFIDVLPDIGSTRLIE